MATFKCKACGKSFKTKAALQRHYAVAHPGVKY
jgi:uncharacterized C2H2 Zn-finger protein